MKILLYPPSYCPPGSIKTFSPQHFRLSSLAGPLFTALVAWAMTWSAVLAAPVPAGLKASDWSGLVQLMNPIVPQAYIKPSNTGANDEFGYAVAVSGDTLVVGAPFEASNATGVNGNQTDNSLNSAGAVYIFVRTGTTWTQQAYLKASNTGAFDHFGYSVSVSGDTLVVGAPLEASHATGVNGNQADNSANSAGAAYVFVRTGTTWTQQAYLKASNTRSFDNFGYSVSVSGDTVVVGAYGEPSNATGVNGNQSNNSAPNSGAAYVFVRAGTTWSQQAYIKASNTGTLDYFGYSVVVTGDTVVAGAPLESSNATGVNGNQGNNSATNSGAAYVFVRTGTTWTQQAYLKASNTRAFDNFGWSVSVSGDTVVAGAYGESSNATGVNGNQSDHTKTNSGAAYVFVRSGTTWTQEAYLKASNTGMEDYFGFAVVVSGNTVVVGAYGEDSNATGLNGTQSDNSASFSGAAYLFVRSGTTWTQQDYLKASNTGEGDYFGNSVALSGDTVVIGAYGEASNATGVNGNQGDNSTFFSGAAYVLTGASSALSVRPSLSIMRSPMGGGYDISLQAQAGFGYRLERASEVTGQWIGIETKTSLVNGLLEFHDASPLAGQAFYRTATP